MKQIIINYNKPNKDFSLLFNKEKVKLKKILPKTAIIEHVGSTSVPNLGGKNFIDIFIAVPEKSIKKTKNVLNKNKYVYDSQWKKRMFFVKKYSTQRFNIHLLPIGNVEFRNAVILRNYLRSHKKEVIRYIQQKKKAVKFGNGDGKKYREYKHPFMVEMIENAKKWNKRV